MFQDCTSQVLVAHLNLVIKLQLGRHIFAFLEISETANRWHFHVMPEYCLTLGHHGLFKS